MKTVAVLLFAALLAGCVQPSPNPLSQAQASAFIRGAQYDKCMVSVAKEERRVSSCIRTKLVEQGYLDGLDCTSARYSNRTVCLDTNRYNAEVYASWDCPYNASVLTPMDCVKLRYN
jgi:hypothetical protein